MTAAKAKLLIMGLDGLDAGLLEAFFKKKLCPNLKKLRNNSQYTTFLPALPLVSPAIWTSYFTGALPQEHGLVDLLSKAPESYQLTACSAHNRLMPTIFAQLARQGYKVAALGFPGSYPAERVPNAAIISGFDAPWSAAANDLAFSNKNLAAFIRKNGNWRYGVVNEFLPLGNSRKMAALLLARLRQDFYNKSKQIKQLLAKKEWDLFAFHLQLADSTSHHLWHFDDPASPLHPQHNEPGNYQEEIYTLLDNFVGELQAMVGENCQIMVLSDHGMGGSNGTIVHLNSILAKTGLLTFSRTSGNHLLKYGQELFNNCPENFKLFLYDKKLPPALLNKFSSHALLPPIDFARTKVWAQEIDASPALFINLAGRDPLGQVKAREIPALTDKLWNIFTKLRDPISGEPLFDNLLAAAQLTTNPVKNAADYYLSYNWQSSGYRATVTPSIPGEPCFTFNRRAAGKGLGMPGVHRGGGLYFLKAPQVRTGAVAPKICTAVYHDICRLLSFEPPQCKEQNLPEFPAIDERANKAILKQLQHLGYID